MRIIYSISVFLFFSLSINLQAQHRSSEIDRWSLGGRFSHLYDIGAYRYDTEFSRDMKGLNGDYTNFDIGYSFYLERMFNPIFGLQFTYTGGAMTGANDVEYYENSFNEAGLDFMVILSNWSPYFSSSPWNVYSRLGLANGRFKAEQFLQADQVQDNSFEDNYWKYQGGLGIQYELNQSWRLELDFSLNTVLNDGFDGYNSASGSDVYWATGIGLAYSFHSQDASPVYQMGVHQAPAALPQVEKAKSAKAEMDSTQWLALQEESKSLKETLLTLQQKQDSLVSALKSQEPSPTAPQTAIKQRRSSAVYFAFDSDYLSADARKDIISNWAWAKGEETLEIRLIAYADATGPESYNQDLKRKRAEAVRDFLVEMGFSADQIVIDIAAPSPLSNDHRFLNRRVEIVGKA